ncbi:hypothetical protein Bca101_043809 [Brassica carinata]
METYSRCCNVSTLLYSPGTESGAVRCEALEPAESSSFLERSLGEKYLQKQNKNISAESLRQTMTSPITHQLLARPDKNPEDT